MPDDVEPPDDNVVNIEAERKKRQVRFSPTLLQIGRVLRTEPELYAGKLYKLDHVFRPDAVDGCAYPGQG